MSDKWQVTFHSVHRFPFQRLIRCYLAADIWQAEMGLFSPLAFSAQMIMINISSNTFFILLRKTIQWSKQHEIKLLPFALQSATDGAMVIGGFMTAAHTACFKQTSWINKTRDNRSTPKQIVNGLLKRQQITKHIFLINSYY